MLSATAGDDNTFRLGCDQVDSEVLTVLLCVTLHVDMGLSGLDSRFLPTHISKFLFPAWISYFTQCISFFFQCDNPFSLDPVLLSRVSPLP
jgi:hypothetical protein